jgi:hypothetical protein
MKTINLTFILTFLFVNSLLMSCETNEMPGIDCPINTSKLSGSYRIISIVYKETSTSPVQNAPEFLNSCMGDDLIFLNTDGTYYFKDSGLSCGLRDDARGNWSLNGNTLTSDHFLLHGTVSYFDCNTLIYYFENIYNSTDRIEIKMLKQ